MEISLLEIIREFRKGHLNAASILIENFKKTSLQDETLKIYLIELQQNISFLNQDFELLINHILKIDLFSKSDSLIEEYQLFLINLVSAHPYYLQSVCKKLLTMFSPNIKDVSDENRKNCDRIFDHVHHTFGIITELIPLLGKVLIPVIKSTFPYIKKDVFEQASYVSNLLKLCDYLPSLEQEIIEIIIDKLLKIDVYSPKQQIQDSLEVENDEEDLVFHLEYTINETKKPSSTDRMSDELADKLDVLLEIVIKYIHNKCYQKDILNWEATKNLYKKLFFVFEKIILPTHDASHVQFIMFYICSFKQSLFEDFLEHLWKNVQNPDTPMILRQHSVAYLAGLVARAKYVDTRTTISLLNLLVGWIHRYIDNQTSSSRHYPDATTHGTFYSVCQAVFYVIAFRYKEFVHHAEGLKYLQELNFARIINCQLNPLKLCITSVVNNFAAITRTYQLVYCYTIIERNNRILLPIVNSNRELANVNPLDSFFPFDPYLLLRSGHYITPLYQTFEGNLTNQEMKVDVEDDDDFLEDESLKAHHPSSPMFEDMFSYGSSPGFRTVLPFTTIY